MVEKSKEICKEEYIIFGAGKVGMELLEYFGSKKVLCILDNNFLKYDGFLREVPVVPVEQILDFYSPNVTVIIATIKKKFLIEMASQLIKLSIPFSFYEEIFDGVKNPILQIKLKEAERTCFLAYGMKGKEEYDYYEFTTSFLISFIQENHLYDKVALSIGGRIGGVVAVANLFSTVFHCSMMPMQDSDDFRKIFATNKLIEINTDFWKLNDERIKNVEFVFSHATIHCLNDTRYGNLNKDLDRIKKVPQHLKKICPKLKYILVSVPVNLENHFEDNNTWLGNESIIEEFDNAGFELKKAIYDKKCLDNKFDNRFSLEFPRDYCMNHMYIIGNFLFVRN